MARGLGMIWEECRRRSGWDVRLPCLRGLCFPMASSQRRRASSTATTLNGKVLKVGGGLEVAARRPVAHGESGRAWQEVAACWMGR